MPFDYNEYQQKCNTLSTEQLHREWENYTRQIAGGATSTATSVLFSPVTGGISLIGLGLSAPRIHNARKKREIIEAGLQARGATHNTRKRDVVAPMAIAGTISGLTLGLAGPGADIIAGEAVGKGAEYAISHAALDGTGALLEHKHDEHLKIKAEQKMRMQQQQQQGLQGQRIQGQVQGVQVQPQMIPYQVQTPLPGTQILHPMPQIQVQPSLPTIQYQQPQNGVPDQKYVYVTMPPPQQNAVAYQPASHQQSFGQPPPAPLTTPQPVPSYQTNQPTRSQPEIAPAIPSAPKPTEGYPPEKTPAYTTQGFHPEEDSEFQHPAGCPTPLPLYSQLDKSQVSPPTDGKNSQELPSQTAETEPVTVALTMEEEIMFLKARLLQMEIEKREGVKPAIPATPPETQSSPEKKEEVPARAQYSHQTQEPPSAGHQQHPSLSITTAPTTQPSPQYYAPPPASPAPSAVSPMIPPQQYQAPPSPNPQFYPPPPPRSPHPQANAPPPMQQQQTYPPLPTTPQPQQQAYHPPQPQQQQGYPPQPHTPQPQQQQIYPQPPKSPQPQFQRNDSGYASMASTPMPQYNPQQPYNPQQQYNPQTHIVSPQSTGASMLSPQITGPPQQYGHGRTASYSQPSPMSPAPPPYFPPPPGQQVAGGGNGKDYFGQAGQQQGYQPQQGTQGWQWGAPSTSVPVGQPNYGPPPPAPMPYR